MCHTWRKVIFVTFEGLSCFVLGFSFAFLMTKWSQFMFVKPEEEVTMILNSTVPTDTRPDFITIPILAVAVICPIVAHIIDPHRRHVIIHFKYQHPDKATNDGDFQNVVVKGKYGDKKYLDKCLDRHACC